MKKILVTGAAGFLAFHAIQALLQRGYSVLGIDSYTPYYSLLLKKARTDILQQKGVQVQTLDVQDQGALQTLLEQHQITHVLHLAAQAGVRHSLQDPYSYLASNIQGFVSLLEAIKNTNPTIRLVYASSSSVYGTNTKIPFSVTDPVDAPANLYGATKKTNELLAHAYHHLYQIPCIGLRYFTVYGPWGRPDMAYFRFAQKLLREEPLPLFGQGQLERDFTYIDDIVEGTLAALEYSAPFALFNLGNSKPQSTLHLVQALEKHLQKKALLEPLPMQPGEVCTTYADISVAEQELSFSPKISLDEGIARFSSWFLSHPQFWDLATGV